MWKVSRLAKLRDMTSDKDPMAKIPMDSYRACEIAEGFGSGEDATDEEKREAWQYIYDTGMYRTLQGWYGRTVRDLLDAGLIEPRETT